MFTLAGWRETLKPWNVPFVEPVSPKLFAASLGAGWRAGLWPGSVQGERLPSNGAHVLQVSSTGSKVCDAIQVSSTGPKVCDG